jgi:putative tryptophan/tyrosine transport system substrate-binding protein
MPVVGFLGTMSPDDFADRVAAFREGLKQVDYVEGQNLVVEYRWPEGNYDRLATLAADLVRRRVASRQFIPKAAQLKLPGGLCAS